MNIENAQAIVAKTLGELQGDAGYGRPEAREIIASICERPDGRTEAEAEAVIRLQNKLAKAIRSDGANEQAQEDAADFILRVARALMHPNRPPQRADARMQKRLAAVHNPDWLLSWSRKGNVSEAHFAESADYWTRLHEIEEQAEIDGADFMTALHAVYAAKPIAA